MRGRGSVGVGLALCALVSGYTGGLIRGETGRLLWKARLPAGAQATPMTYEIAGTQYVLICAGGHGKLGAPCPGERSNTDG